MKRPEDIFTPRRSDVNDRMYIDRPGLQTALRRALASGQHLMIHGESGNGKSWLYKYVFAQDGVSFIIANMANASRLGSLGAELSNLISREGIARKVSYEEEKSAGIGGTKLSHKGKFDVAQKEPFEAVLEFLKESKKSTYALLVFDNFEQILNESEIAKDVANCIILLDDQRYSQYGVRIVLVGVPSGVERYFSAIPNVAPIINRIIEIPEVSRLSDEEAKILVRKGFIEELGISFDNETIIDAIVFISDCIPQFLHEVCLILAQIVVEQKESSVSWDALKKAALAWVAQSLSSTYAVIDSQCSIDERTNFETRLLLALSRMQTDEMRPEYIFAQMRDMFLHSNVRRVNHITKSLKKLAGAARPIIRETPNGKGYRFVRPQYRICTRVMFYVDEFDNVRKLEVGDLIDSGALFL